MSNFLALCQRVRQECGVAGTGPATVVSQTGMYAKIVNWTARAWVDIQASAPYWKFLRNYTTKTLTIGVQDYNVSTAWSLTSVDKWDPEGAFIYETSVSDQSQLAWQDYPTFRALNSHGFQSGRPESLVERQGNIIRFNRVPDKAYVITLDYWMTPELLAGNTDTPSAPEQYHDAIVWKAVQSFAGVEGAPELMTFAKSEYNRIYTQLMLDQLEIPARNMAFPLASGRTSSSDTDRWGS